MFISRKLAVMAAALMLSLPLAACGNDGPSDSEVKKAVRQEMAQDMIAMNPALNGLSTLQNGNAQSDSNMLPSDHLTPDEQSRLDKIEIDVGAKTRQADGSYDVVITIAGQTNIEKFVKGSDGWQLMDDDNSGS